MKIKISDCFKCIFTVLLLACLFKAPLSAQTDAGPGEPAATGFPHIALGFGGTYGYYNIQNATGSGPGKPKGGYGYGGGFIFENMFSKLIGAQTGAWYTSGVFKYNDGTRAKSTSLMIPLYLTISFDLRPFTFSLLSGFQYLYFTKVVYSFDSPSGRQTFDVLKYLNYNQIGMAGGIEIKLHISFVDLFVSMTAEHYFSTFSSMSQDSSPARDHLYGFISRAGVMFRTY